MSFSRHQDGFSLIELMIAVAIITIVAAVGLPAYRSYVDTANMTRVNSAYQNAIQTVQGAYSKDTARITLGLTSDLPTSGAQWVTFLDDGSTLAPGGGPIYISVESGKKAKKGKKSKSSSEPDYGDPDDTGAITIKFDTKKQRVEITRPEYLHLTSFRARISRDNLEIAEKQKSDVFMI